MFKDKKGITPVIASVLLIAVVVILAGIVFLWARGFVEEGLQKRGEPVERSCVDVQFEALIVNNAGEYELEVANQANIHLYGIKLKEKYAGDVKVYNVDFEGTSLGLGESRKISLNGIDISEDSEYSAVPVLLGARGNQREAYDCGDEFSVDVRVV